MWPGMSKVKGAVVAAGVMLATIYVVRRLLPGVWQDVAAGPSWVPNFQQWFQRPLGIGRMAGASPTLNQDPDARYL